MKLLVVKQQHAIKFDMFKVPHVCHHFLLQITSNFSTFSNNTKFSMWLGVLGWVSVNQSAPPESVLVSVVSGVQSDLMRSTNQRSIILPAERNLLELAGPDSRSPRPAARPPRRPPGCPRPPPAAAPSTGRPWWGVRGRLGDQPSYSQTPSSSCRRISLLRLHKHSWRRKPRLPGRLQVMWLTLGGRGNCG